MKNIKKIVVGIMVAIMLVGGVVIAMPKTDNTVAIDPPWHPW